MNMNKICKCGIVGTTMCDCETCEKYICRECARLVVMKNELFIFHNDKCVPKQYRKEE